MRPAFTYGIPPRISKPCTGQSGFENSVRKGNNLIQLSFIYLIGPTLSYLEFQISSTTSINSKCYTRITHLKDLKVPRFSLIINTRTNLY
jgi:hypothetical protein